MTVDWSSSPATLELARDEVHVWRATLSADQTILRNFESTLAPDEKARAARFVFENDRNRYIVAHGILRDLLSRYLRCAPEAIAFKNGPRGKPQVVGPDSESVIRFNLSHSHALAVVAVSKGREIGIDVELIRPEFASEGVAARYFSRREVAELRQLPEELRAEGFFLCWTRKEAYIKARGEGLHIRLDSFDVSLTPDKPATLSSADESRWKIESFVPSRASEPRYVGAIVAEGKDWIAHYFEWNRRERKIIGGT